MNDVSIYKIIRSVLMLLLLQVYVARLPSTCTNERRQHVAVDRCEIGRACFCSDQFFFLYDDDVTKVNE